VLLGKPKDKFEVYNDLDDELVNLFRCVRDRPAEFLLELGLLPLNSRTEFGEWLKFHTGRRDPVLFLPTQDVILDNLLPMQQWAEQMKKALHDRADYKEVLQAAAFFKRMRNSYASSGRSFACQPFSVRTTFRQLEETSDRPSNVIVENQSFETLIPHYDREDSLVVKSLQTGSQIPIWDRERKAGFPESDASAGYGGTRGKRLCLL
jgi:DNA adenine methylase